MRSTTCSPFLNTAREALECSPAANWRSNSVVIAEMVGAEVCWGIVGWLGAVRCVTCSGMSGQPIAIVGKMYRSSMLHFEMYSSGKTNQRWTGFPSGSAPSRLLNPTNFLLTLANRKISGTTVVKEPVVKTQPCR